MSIESRKYQYGTVFGHWQIKEIIGRGSDGKSAVFRLEHTVSPGVFSALKVISLIEEQGKIEELSPLRKDDYVTARERCYRQAEQEVLLMDTLQGRTNIVDYLDHSYVDWSDESGFGRDMLIRMELLRDLRRGIREGRAFSEKEALKVGRDICNALILCHGKNIIHRDIKPENIFVNSSGDYKLGDFGISKITVNSSSRASTGIGTPQYEAPEQLSNSYDRRVDIYSLGLVLYELMVHHIPCPLIEPGVRAQARPSDPPAEIGVLVQNGGFGCIEHKAVPFPAVPHRAAVFHQQAPSRAAQQKGNGDFHVVLVQAFFPVGIVEDPRLMLSETGQDFSFLAGKTHLRRTAHVLQASQAFVKHDNLTVRGLSDISVARGRIQTVHRPLRAGKPRLRQKYPLIVSKRQRFEMLRIPGPQDNPLNPVP